MLPSTDSAYLSWEVPTGPASCCLSVLLSEFCPDKNRWLTQTNKQTSASGAHKGAVTAQHHGPLDFKPDEARLTLIHRKMQHVFHVVRFPLPPLSPLLNTHPPWKRPTFEAAHVHIRTAIPGRILVCESAWSPEPRCKHLISLP